MQRNLKGKVLDFVGRVAGQPDWADWLERQCLPVVPVNTEAGRGDCWFKINYKFFI